MTKWIILRAHISFNTRGIYKEQILKVIEEHKDYTQLYKNGSMDGSKVGLKNSFQPKLGYQMMYMYLF